LLAVRSRPGARRNVSETPAAVQPSVSNGPPDQKTRQDQDLCARERKDCDMNEHARGGRTRRQAGVLAAAGAGAALLAAACGGGSSAVTASSGGSPYQKALAYAQCLRSHGDLLWPDPDSQGNFVIDNPGMLNGYQSADNACKKLAPPVGLTPAEQQQKIAGELKYAGCMRSHGITNFADPKSNEFGFNPRGLDTSSPQYQSAQQACRSLLSGTPGDGAS
jgi:hypothetical protein